MAAPTARFRSRRGVSRSPFGPYQPLVTPPAADQNFLTYYTSDFEAATPGALPAGLAAGTFYGSTPSAAVVSTVAPVKGTKSLRDPAPVNGGAVFWDASLADQEVALLNRTGRSGSSQWNFCPVLRSDKVANGYFVSVDIVSDVIRVYSLPSLAVIASSALISSILGRAAVDGDLLWVRAQAVGSVIRAKVWLDGSPEPSVWHIGVTDATYATGYAGLGGTVADAAHAVWADNLTVRDPTTRTADDPGFAYVGRWGPPGATRTTITNGSSCEFSYTGNSCVLHFDVSAAGIQYPVIAYSADGGAWTRVTLDSSGDVTLAPAVNTLPSGAPPFASVRSDVHRVRFLAVVCGEAAPYDDWTSLRDALKFTGATLAGGRSLLTLPANPGTIEFLGDSITGGLRILYTSADEGTPAADAPESGWPEMVGRTLGLAPVVNGHGGQGITVPANDGTPAATAAFPYSYGGVAYAPAHRPVAVVVYMGTNEPSFTRDQYQAYLTTIRAAYPAAVIFAVVPFLCSRHLTAAQAAVAALVDPQLYLLDYSAAFTVNTDTSDGVHFNPGGAVRMACLLSADVSARLAALGVRVGRAGRFGG